MSIEFIEKSSNNVLETRRGKVRSWSELSSYLSEDINPHHMKFIRSYFKAQLRIAESRRNKAREIFNGLEKKVGYKEFEQENPSLLAAIDIVVRGSTNRKPKEGPTFQISEKD